MQATRQNVQASYRFRSTLQVHQSILKLRVLSVFSTFRFLMSGSSHECLHFWDSTFDLERRNYLMILGRIANPPKQFPQQRTSSFRCICFRYLICFLENALLAGINWLSVFTRPRSRCGPKKKTNPRYQSSGKTRSQI